MPNLSDYNQAGSPAVEIALDKPAYSYSDKIAFDTLSGTLECCAEESYKSYAYEYETKKFFGDAYLTLINSSYSPETAMEYAAAAAEAYKKI